MLAFCPCPDISSIAPMETCFRGLQGGGLFIYGTATLTDTTVYSNTATRSGPNVLVDDNAGQLTVSYLVDLTGVEGSVTVLPAPPPPPPPPSPPLPPPPPMICLDTCGTAGDAVCQDGDWGAFGSMCEFGTDCSDCGSRLLPPGIDVEATGDSVTAQDAGPGLALGLALGGCLLVRSWRCWRGRGHIRLAPQAPHAAIRSPLPHAAIGSKPSAYSI